MSTYSKIKLTETEQRFVDSFMDSNIHPQHVIYWDMLKRFLTKYQTDHQNQSALVTKAVATISENILYKIYMAEADKAIESILDGTMTGTATKPNIKRAVRKNLTKALSYDEFILTHGHNVQAKVLEHLNNNPGISRRQIASNLGIRLSTVCGAVNVLYKHNLIRVSGVTVDPDSDRKVEILEVR